MEVASSKYCIIGENHNIFPPLNNVGFGIYLLVALLLISMGTISKWWIALQDNFVEAQEMFNIVWFYGNYSLTMSWTPQFTFVSSALFTINYMSSLISISGCVFVGNWYITFCFLTTSSSKWCRNPGQSLDYKSADEIKNCTKQWKFEKKNNKTNTYCRVMFQFRWIFR